jgi:hypothetical protein
MMEATKAAVAAGKAARESAAPEAPKPTGPPR